MHGTTGHNPIQGSRLLQHSTNKTLQHLYRFQVIRGPQNSKKRTKRGPNFEQKGGPKGGPNGNMTEWATFCYLTLKSNPEICDLWKIWSVMRKHDMTNINQIFLHLWQLVQFLHFFFTILVILTFVENLENFWQFRQFFTTLTIFLQSLTIDNISKFSTMFRKFKHL